MTVGGKGQWRGDLGTVFRGLLMGAADVIPGVSGGTVALIVGIYERLVTAISHVDTRLLGYVRHGQWRLAASHIDLRFLTALLLGIATGIIGLGGLVNRLLTSPLTRAATLAAFFGMILASALLVARLIPLSRRWETVSAGLFGCAGALFAYWLTGLPGSEAEATFGYGFVFICGLVAICAMILPGISGAYILLILGLYLHLTDILKRLPHGDVTARDAGTILVFGAGCVIGIVSFSKALRWLLARYHAQTMAVLCGFMFGALRKVWPFQVDQTPEVVELNRKVYVNVIPTAWEPSVVVCGLAALAAMIAVFLVDRYARPQTPPQVVTVTPAMERSSG